MFFLLWPLFARAPRHWFLENFLLSAPGVQSVLFFVALRWAPRPFGGARAKKTKTPPRVFFFAPAPGKGRGRRSPVGQSKKKNTLGGVFFFALAPCRRPTGLLLPLPFPGAGAKKHPGWCFFFLLWPRAGTQRGFSLPCLSPGPQPKKKPGWCFFFLLWPRAGTGLLLPLPFPGAGAKKKTPWVVFFCCGPARTLTHSLRAWVAMPPPRRGGVFFLLRPRPDRGGVFFFFLLWPRPDAHSLTVGWGDFGKARVVFFFCCGPAGSF